VVVVKVSVLRRRLSRVIKRYIGPWYRSYTDLYSHSKGW
jgi:hypothetical protein